MACKYCNTCDTCQSFCQVGSQLASSHGVKPPWPSKFEKDQIIIEHLPQSKFYEAFKYVADAAKIGKTNSGGWKIDTSGDYQKEFIYADQVNDLINGIESLDGSNKNKVDKVKKDDIITAEYFTKLSQALISLNLSTKACDVCNTGCNQCTSCQYCTGCEGYSPA